MSAPESDEAVCAALARDFDFPRYAATLFCPAEKRRAWLALAAFDLEVRRIADQVTQPLPGEVRLQWWADAVQGTEHGGVAGHPVAAELLRAIDAQGWARPPLVALIEAHKFDLYDDPMPTLAALEVYCDDTVGSLIALQSGLPGDDASVREAGRALGLARIVTHLAHDAARRRCFLPNDLMSACGTNRAAVLAGEETTPLQDVRSVLIGTARRSLARARSFAKALPRERRAAFLPLASLEAELNGLQSQPVFAVAEPPSRLRVLASQWWMAR